MYDKQFVQMLLQDESMEKLFVDATNEEASVRFQGSDKLLMRNESGSSERSED